MPKFFILENKKFPKIVEKEVLGNVFFKGADVYSDEKGLTLYLTKERARRARVAQLEQMAHEATETYRKLINKINKWKLKLD